MQCQRESVGIPVQPSCYSLGDLNTDSALLDSWCCDDILSQCFQSQVSQNDPLVVFSSCIDVLSSWLVCGHRVSNRLWWQRRGNKMGVCAWSILGCHRVFGHDVEEPHLLGIRRSTRFDGFGRREFDDPALIQYHDKGMQRGLGSSSLMYPFGQESGMGHHRDPSMRPSPLPN